MKFNLSSGNILIYGSILTLLFIFSLIFSFIREDLFLVTTDYYAEEVGYEKYKEDLKNADLYGDRIHIEKTGNSILLNIPLDIAKELTSGELKAYFPSLPSYDQLFVFTKNDSGKYQFEVLNSRNLPFTLKLKFSDSNKSYAKQFRM